MILRPFARCFADPIYRVDYFVVCAEERDYLPALRKLLRSYTILSRKTQQEILDRAQHPLTRCAGRCIRLSNPKVEAVVIWLRPGADISVLVHEAWHAAYWVFEGRVTAWNDGVDEPMAYYLQWIVRQALRLAYR